MSGFSDFEFSVDSASRNSVRDLNTTPSNGPELGGGDRTANKELMAEARRSLEGNWGVAVLGYLLYTVLIFSFAVFVLSLSLFVGYAEGIGGGDMDRAVGYIQLVGQWVGFFVSGSLIVGLCCFYLGIAQEGTARLEKLFAGFRRFGAAFGAYFFYSLFIGLWALLFIIPGIIAMFRYAMAFFIIADDEDCGPLEAIRRSKEMMKGNKWKYFCLNWRFFWWGCLCMMLPMGAFWLVPYMQTSFAQFYEDVK